MDALTEIFSRLCGQGRCFLIGGEAMPVCQRCLGLYLGAALTGAWIAASGVWRRGLPARTVIIADTIMLLAALLGGVHVLDIGPRWRLLCGLWTGHVAMLWLSCGAGCLKALAGKAVIAAPSGAPPPGAIPSGAMLPLAEACSTRNMTLQPAARNWNTSQQLQALAAGPLLAGLALAFNKLTWVPRSLWLVAIVAGAAFMALTLAGACAALICWTRALLSRRTSGNPSPFESEPRDRARSNPLPSRERV